MGFNILFSESSDSKIPWLARMRERQRKGVADRLGGAHLMVESN